MLFRFSHKKKIILFVIKIIKLIYVFTVAARGRTVDYVSLHNNLLRVFKSVYGSLSRL